MDVGVVQMPVDSWPDTIERTRQLEALGFDHVWLYDHLSWRHYRDRAWHAALPWLTAMAAGTERIGLGTMVVSPTLRHPLLLAKEAMSIDHVSQGRLILGLGAGSAGFDATAYGDRPLEPAERADRLEEYATVLDGLLRGSLTDHQGRWYTVDGGRVLPGCVQRPRVPLALASGGRRTTRLAAALADSWITIGDRTTPPADPSDYLRAIETQVGWLEQACDQIGRDPASIGRIGMVSSTFPSALASLQTFTELAAAMDQLGFEAIVIHDHRDDDPALDIGPELIDGIADWRRSTGRQASGPDLACDHDHRR